MDRCRHRQTEIILGKWYSTWEFILIDVKLACLQQNKSLWLCEMVKSVEKPKPSKGTTSVWGRTGGLDFERRRCQHADTSSRCHLCVQIFLYIICMCALPACSVVSVAHQAPLSMGFSRQEHWSSHFLLQGIFLTQRSNLHLLGLVHCRRIPYPLSHQEDSILVYSFYIHPVLKTLLISCH